MKYNVITHHHPRHRSFSGNPSIQLVRAEERAVVTPRKARAANRIAKGIEPKYFYPN